MTDPVYDLISMGRSSIDLYSNDIGAEFEEIKTFSSFVGGCPTNIAVGARRLNLRTVLLTAVGADPVGDFVLNFLKNEGVDTGYISRKPGFRTSAVLLGIKPPDKFPLVFYREKCADIQLTLEDVDRAPIEKTRALLVSGTGLSREPSRSATTYAMEKARAHGAKVILDLDFRADQWQTSDSADVRAYGVTVRSLLHWVDIAIGTEEEIRAAMLKNADHLTIQHSQISAPEVGGDTATAIQSLLSSGPRALVVKRGEKGAAIYLADGELIESSPFKVEVVNVLGAGDAFAAGFIYGYLKSWPWQKCLRMGNATGAIVVTRQGCANFMPYEQETLEFIEHNGGFMPKEAICP